MIGLVIKTRAAGGPISGCFTFFFSRCLMSVLYRSLKKIKHFLVRLLIQNYKVKTEFLLVPFKNPTIDFTI